jgi:cytochrome c553
VPALHLASADIPAEQGGAVALSRPRCEVPAYGLQGGVPGLAGRDRAELVALMAAFRANERPATIMGRITRGYSEAEIASSAEYFSQQGR